MTLSHSNLHKITLNVHVENEYIKLTKLEEKQPKFYVLKSNFLTIVFQTEIPKKADMHDLCEKAVFTQFCQFLASGYVDTVLIPYSVISQEKL